MTIFMKTTTELKDFDKTITQEERDAPSYLDWPDETLARFVRSVAQHIYTSDTKGMKGIMSAGAFIILINMAKSTNSASIDMEMSNVVTGDGEPASNWHVTVKKTK